MPKFGFTNPNRVEYNGVNIDTLQQLFDSKKIKSYKKLEQLSKYIKSNAVSWSVDYETNEISGDRSSPRSGYILYLSVCFIHRLRHIDTHLACFVLCHTIIQQNIVMLNQFITKQ